MYAVVNSGGKQAKVEAGTVLAVERLKADVGATVELPVIFVADGDAIFATPADVAGAVVTAEVLEHFKGEKQIVFKFKKRKGYKRTTGHRQTLTSVRIIDITLGGVAPKPAKSEKAARPKADQPEKPAKTEKVAKAEKPAKAVEPAAEAPIEAPVEVPVAVAEIAGSSGMCAATKSDGSPCANKAKPGSQYCGVHAKKFEG